MMLGILIFFLAGNVCAFSVNEISSSTKRIEFESEYSQYDQKNETIRLSTNVTVRQMDIFDEIDKKIKSQDILINAKESLIIFDTPFSIEDSTGMVKAKEGFYDYSKNYGKIKDGVFYAERFIIRGKSIVFSQKSYRYRKASLTTCDEDPPHYRIAAHTISFVPGKRFIAYSTIFYIGKIPVFYFPIVYKPLGAGTAVLSQFYPGYDERNGFYVKSNYIYKFNKYSKFKLFVDYFSKKGLGTGLETDYYDSEKNISSIAFYRIREYSDETDRWGLNGGMWHSFNREKSFYFQNYFRLLSDPKFNNDFFRSNPFAVSSDKQSSAAFTYSAPKTLTRLSYYNRYVSASSDNESFNKTYESLPALTFQTVPLKLPGLGTFNSYNFNIQHVKDNTPYYQNKAYGSWIMSLPVKVYKKFNVYPELFYFQNVNFSTSSFNSDEWVGRYGLRITARQSMSWGSLDLSFYSLRRNKINKMSLDSDAADRGVESQRLDFSVFYIKSSKAYLRLASGYDLKNYGSKLDFKERLSAVTVESYFSSVFKEIFFQDTYDIVEGNKSFVSQMNFGNEKEYFQMGLANYSQDKNKWIVSNGIGFIPPIPGKWRTELVLRYFTDVSGKFRLNFFEKSAFIYKDFHDFRTKFNIRVREDVKEFFVYLTLKMNDPYKNDEMSKKADYFWRPWREEGQQRD